MLRMNIFFYILTVFFSVNTFASECNSYLSNQSFFNKSKDNIFFKLLDKNDNAFYFEAYINKKGEVYISAFLSSNELGIRSSISGKKAYLQMIRYFGHSNINVINARWVDGINYDKFFEGLKDGLSENEAAMRTWSGKMASKNGFTKVKLVEILKDKFSGRSTVLVKFIRP